MQHDEQHSQAGFLVLRRETRGKSNVDTEIYRGFDAATLWPGLSDNDLLVELGLAPASQLAAVRYLKAQQPDTETMYVQPLHAESCPVDAKLLGYDLGRFESTFNYFSILLNEVLHGRLCHLKPMLNNFGLLNDAQSALRILAERERLRVEGVDVEELDSPPTVYAIYGDILLK